MMGLLQNAQNHELEQSRPVVMLKTKYFVTLNMIETNFCCETVKKSLVEISMAYCR